ncbi:hypothetical protein H9Y04_18625 [Streptomyces sp. TRM66268-LWL]|uniref:DUF1023 domain-containing protein n=1 Tax=Streptomyces polyasparticus TaxID=2767826 RepID=A0ABR7SGG2_9ACTN|nr:alpha/beta hydrolase [Streptomyces polyasparticus]MBC9714575.1 hypothetical protein [Streptomyces polyasparticus]
MLTWQQLRDLDCGKLDNAADGWASLSRTADDARDRVDTDMVARVGKTQEGEAAKAAVKRLRRLSDNYRYVHREAALIRGTLDSLAFELRTPQRDLKQALDEAAERGFSVDAKGWVTYPSSRSKYGDAEVPGGTVVGRIDPLSPRPSASGRLDSGSEDLIAGTNPQRAFAEGVADRIARAVADAIRIDERYNSALRKLRAAPGLTVNARTWEDVALDAGVVSGEISRYIESQVPVDKSPAERKAWWDGLSPAQRDEFLALAPEVIGNLDGIPATARDEANRAHLPMLIDQMEAAGGEDAKTMLTGLRRIEERLHEPTRPPMFLLGVGAEGNGRAIVSFGDPDKARNVSAYVPGLGTKLDEEFANGTVDRALHTAVGARRYDPSSASIVWLGYDAPQTSPGDLVSGESVMSEAQAAKGAPAYNEFMAGVSATNRNADPHVTAVGHSYGSLTVGLAAQREGGIPGADDIVLVGSPGTSADKASDLNVGKDHGGPLVSWAFGDLADQGDDNVWFGKDPASETFGAQRFLQARSAVGARIQLRHHLGAPRAHRHDEDLRRAAGCLPRTGPASVGEERLPDQVRGQGPGTPRDLRQDKGRLRDRPDHRRAAAGAHRGRDPPRRRVEGEAPHGTPQWPLLRERRRDPPPQCPLRLLVRRISRGIPEPGRVADLNPRIRCRLSAETLHTVARKDYAART